MPYGNQAHGCNILLVVKIMRCQEAEVYIYYREEI